jgi:hypothetical protein
MLYLSSHAFWLPRFDSNENQMVQSHLSCQLDDKGINLTNYQRPVGWGGGAKKLSRAPVLIGCKAWIRTKIGGFKGHRPAVRRLCNKLVTMTRIELVYAAYETAALPLSYTVSNWLRAGESNSTRHSTWVMRPVRLPNLVPAQTWMRSPESNRF